MSKQFFTSTHPHNIDFSSPPSLPSFNDQDQLDSASGSSEFHGFAEQTDHDAITNTLGTSPRLVSGDEYKTYNIPHDHKAQLATLRNFHTSENTSDSSIENPFDFDSSSASHPAPPSEVGVLFPEITSDSFRLKKPEDSATNAHNVVALIDDTASAESICIDDSAEPLESMARAIIKSSKYESQNSAKKDGKLRKSSLKGSSFISPFTDRLRRSTVQESRVSVEPNDDGYESNESLEYDASIREYAQPSTGNNDSTDFEFYKRQTATQILAERQRERRENRQLRRRLHALKKEQYFGNYFKDADPNLEGEVHDFEFSHASYAVDHFNGHRQHNQYFTHSAGDIYLNGTAMDNHNISNLVRMLSSGTSIMSQQTDNLDDMSSSNEYSDGDPTTPVHQESEKSSKKIATSSSNHISRNFRRESESTGNEESPTVHMPSFKGGEGESSNVNYEEEDMEYESSSFYDSDGSSDIHGANFGRYHLPHKGLKRKLYSRHLTSIGAASSIGISSMLMFGRTLFTAGPLGALLGYTITGGILYSVVLGYGEIIALIPLHTGLPGTIARVVNPSMGYAIGVSYWLSNAIALPAELTAAAMMLTNYEALAEHNVIIVWIIYIFFLVILINMCSVRIYGEFQFVVNLLRIVLISFLTILLIVLNISPTAPAEPIGFKYWLSSKSSQEEGWYYGPFRPLFPIHTVLGANGDDVVIWGISGSIGRFVQVWAAILQTSRAYVSTPIALCSVGEARNPRKSLARATKYIFWQISCFYVLVVFILGLNVYAGDIDLFGVNESTTTKEYSHLASFRSNQTVLTHCDSAGNILYSAYDMGLNVSPWIVALQSAGMCSLASGMNAAFVVFAVSTGSSHLYAASRTLYGLMRLYIEEKKIRYPSWWNMCGWCNDQGVPTAAVILSFPFALLALMTTRSPSFYVFQRLLIVSGYASVVTWAGMAIAFLRFYKAIKSRSAVEGRADSENQISGLSVQSTNISTASSVRNHRLMRDEVGYPFKSPFQPYLAWIGLFGSILILITEGFVVFIKGNWDGSLFVTYYISQIIFCVVYFGHKFLTGSHTKPAVDIDLDSGRRELDRAEWSEDRKYSSRNTSGLMRWMLGRVRFIEVFVQTILGNESTEDDDESHDRPNIPPKKSKKKKKRREVQISEQNSTTPLTMNMNLETVAAAGSSSSDRHAAGGRGKGKKRLRIRH